MPEDATINRTHMTVVLVMSIDGKIADVIPAAGYANSLQQCKALACLFLLQYGFS